MTPLPPVTLTTKSGKISLLPADLKKLSPQVAHSLQEAVAVNKALHINTSTPVQISGFAGFYDINNIVYAANKKLQDPNFTPPSTKGGGAPQVPVVPTNNTPTNIKFNLAPHKWSMPTNQKLFNTSSDNQTQADQSVRRARMWCYLGASDSNYATATQSGSTQAGVVTGGTNVSKSLDTQWGFQFLWNPTQIGTSVQRNANLVPQAMDAFAGRAPLFPGTEALSFVAVINRVNDFACFKALSFTAVTDLANERLDQGVAAYYSKSAGAVQDTVQLVKDLTAKGTMADIEYIFKMINGDGANGATWTNALGRKTADINFLAPTPVAVQFGPNADSLSYVGWVESISVSHQMFTEDMIPVHSEVTINMSTYSQSSLK